MTKDDENIHVEEEITHDNNHVVVDKSMCIGIETLKKGIEISPDVEDSESAAETVQNSTEISPKVEDSESANNTQTGVASCDLGNDLPSKNDDNRKFTLPFRNLADGKKQFFHHAGLLLLLPSILKFSRHIDQKILLQWIASILLGAKNIEQSTSLDLSSLSYFLDQNVIQSLKRQRYFLRTVCTPEVILSALKANIAYCGSADHNIFYYDPHSMPYTGMKKILKGWCGSLGKATKVNYHDFIHNFKGEPVWFESFDNYLDLRERFTGVLSNFANAIGLQPKEMTTIVDRGIYGKKCMEAIDDAGFGLVTWQKNYIDKSWDDSKEVSRFTISRYRNNSRDIKRWQIDFYRDESWDKVKGYYRIIVRILAPGKKNVAQVAILSNGKCSDKLATYSMLNRWIQENDFAYLIRHFGINMITTYGSELYADINEKLIEKEVYSDAYVVLKRTISNVEGKLKTILLRRETAEAEGKSLSKKDELKLEELIEQLAKLKDELKEVKEKEDKCEKLSKAGTSRLKLKPKVLMDVLKISARNIFYSHVEEFRAALDDYRVDHKIYRELTRAPGHISRSDDLIKVELNLARKFEPKVLARIQSFLDKVSLQYDQFRINWKIIQDS